MDMDKASSVAFINRKAVGSANDNEGGLEMQTFLKDRDASSDLLPPDSCKVVIQPAGRKRNESTDWDPFKARNTAKPTTDGETLMHLLKACLGTGILAMAFAFKSAGLLGGLFFTLLVGLICSHCSYILLQSAHELYYRTKVSVLTFPDVGEVAFANGPKWCRKLSKPARVCIIGGIFFTYFGTCCAYAVIIAANIKNVIDPLMGINTDKILLISLLSIPLLILSCVSDLKSLAVCSSIANFMMAAVIAITLYYIARKDFADISTLPLLADVYEWPEYFGITIFAMECIGVIMPLENNMVTPKHILGTCGVHNKGMSIVTMIYLSLGFIGYLSYGSEIQGVISLNLPPKEIGPQIALIFTAFAIFFTYGLQFYVCLDIVWNGVKDKFPKNPNLAYIVIRTFLVLLSVMTAIAVPEIGPFLKIVGALFFSSLGLIFPVLIEMVVFHDRGFGFLGWRLSKNVFILLFGFGALIFGTYSGITDVINYYMIDCAEILKNSKGSFVVNGNNFSVACRCTRMFGNYSDIPFDSFTVNGTQNMLYICSNIMFNNKMENYNFFPNNTTSV